MIFNELVVNKIILSILLLSLLQNLELYHQCSLLWCQSSRNLHLDRHEVMPLGVMVWWQLLNTVVSYLLLSVVLCACADLHFYVAIQSWDHNFITQNRLRH